MSVNKYTMDYNGKTITFETGKLAQQANSAVTVQIGDTVVLATATMAKEAREGVDFFPLMVDYEERYYAAGRILGPRFAKREGRPTDEAVLIGRMIDRGLRPRFPNKLRNEVQIICYPMSFDGVNKPDVISMLAAATALHISDIPFDGPVVATRIGRINGEFVVNPSAEELEHSDLQLVVQGNGEKISMVDCNAGEIADDELAAAFDFALKSMAPLAEFIDNLRKEIGTEKAKPEDLIWEDSFTDDEAALIDEIKQLMLPRLDKYLFNTPKGSKGQRKEILENLKAEVITELTPRFVTETRAEEETREYLNGIIGRFFSDFIEEQVSKAIIERNQRVDGRSLDQIRELSAEVAIFPRTHGTGLFNRGETQVLSIVTLGAPGDVLSMENIEDEGTKKYFHHYNFPPYSVGEVKPIRGAGRREIGHGALAEKALRPVLPNDEDFPYTIRVVSEVMGSNGSSSMASTCSSTLALMDAGIPISKPVAGIAMGLASNGMNWKVVTDLQDLEDGPGGMDFKITSTRKGITAVQMDCKSNGLSLDIIRATITQARPALTEIMNLIESTIPVPKPELSEYAPRIISFMIEPDKIGDVIGPGGKIVREIQDTCEVKVDIEDDGRVLITSTNKENAEKAEKMVRNIVRTVEVGEIFEDAEVVKIIEIGAFVKLTPSTDGMLRISEIDHTHVDKVTDRLKVGDKVKVKVIRIDRGKVEVSMKALKPLPPGAEDRRRDYSRRSGQDRRSGGRPGYRGHRNSRPPRGRGSSEKRY
ncbi:polyribonucleotide nucleotidyltransferase [[Eubacterium] cellulosolvens]